MQDLSITLIQSPLHWEDIDANLEAFQRRIGALEGNSDIIVLPEMFATGFSMNPEQLSEAPEGKAHQWMATMAGTTNSAIAASLMVRDKGQYFNRFLWVNPDQTYYHYDKKHLFRMGEETEHFSAGRKKTIVVYKGWNILPLVCYDLRFPVWSMNRRLGDHFDYDLLLFTANWPARRTKHWRNLLVARAIENQAYVAGVNRTGHDAKGLDHDGNSLIIDPMGNILADAGPSEEAVISSDLDRRFLENWRKRFGVSLDWDKFDMKD